MEKVKSLIQKTPIVFVAVGIIALSVITSTTSIVKVASSFTGKEEEIAFPEVKGIKEAEEEKTDIETANNQTEPTPANKNSFSSLSPTPTKSPTKNPAVNPVANKPAGNLLSANLPNGLTSPSNTSSVPNNRCIVTIFGQQYDVTSLRSTHPGGDVFSCGADNSSKYQSAHGTNVSRLSQYLVTNSSSPNTNPSTGTPGTPTGGNDSEDEEYEDSYEQELEDEKQEFEDAWEQAKREYELQKEQEEHESED